MKMPRAVGAVYVMQAGDRVKIGRSQTPERRVRGLEMQGGARASKRYVTPMHEGYVATEKAAHSIFRDRRVLGEWFKCDFERAKEEVHRLFAAVGEVTDERLRELILQQEGDIDEAVSLTREIIFGSIQQESQLSDEYIPKGYIEARIRGEEAAISAADAIRSGTDPDVCWVENMDGVMGELDRDPTWGRAFLHGYIGTLMEELA